MKDFKNSFIKGLKIGLNVWLGSYWSLFMFFSFGVIHLGHMFKTEINIMDSIALILCIYNTYWISDVVDIRKKIKKSVFHILENSSIKKSDKNFLSDVIFTINWKKIKSVNFTDDEDQRVYLEKLIFKEIEAYSSDTLMEKI